jgi:CRISPR-associated protein Cmr4
MFKIKKLMTLYALTPVHVGSGDNLSYIDMPIQREKHTSFPKIEASSLKGSIRYAMEMVGEKGSEEREIAKKSTAKLLGSSGEKLDENQTSEDVSSSVAISDARILFFPVKSATGIFAWVTCPSVLNRFKQDCDMLNIKLQKDLKKNISLDGDITLIYKHSECNICLEHNNKTKIMLEELVFKVNKESTDFVPWVESILDLLPEEENMLQTCFKSNAVLIPDDDFEYFVTQSTEVITRIKINSNTGIVDKENGALFTEEYLPSETIMYSSLFYKTSEDEACFNHLLKKDMIQVGGNTTLSKGMFRINIGGCDHGSSRD